MPKSFSDRFNFKSSYTTPALNKQERQLFAFGYEGNPADVETRASQIWTHDVNAAHVLSGAMEAYRDGKPQNLAAFIAGYVSARKYETSDLVAAFHENAPRIAMGHGNDLKYLLEPLATIALASKNEKAELKSLLTGMKADMKKYIIDEVTSFKTIHRLSAHGQKSKKGAKPTQYKSIYR